MKAVTYFSFMEKGPNRLSGRSHTHDDSCEILWLCEGEGSMMIGDRLYPMRKNAVYLIGAREVHSAVPTGDSASYLRTAVGVNERFLAELASLGGFEAEVNALFARRCIPCGTKAQMLEKEFEALARALHPERNAPAAASLPDARSGLPAGEPDAKNALIAASCLLDLLRILSGCAEPSEKTEVPPDDPAEPPAELPEKRLPIAETLRFIDENLGEPLTLDLLSSRVYLSKTYFCRLFRESTRMSPMTYITARRISLAKKLLLESGLSVSETALAAGFGSFSNFSNMFRKSEGVTPREYVRRRRSPPA